MAGDRWSRYDGPSARPAAGWAFDVLCGPSRLWGANGIVAAGSQLYVTQVFGSEVASIDVDSGVHDVFTPLGSGIVAPDDGVFGPDGTFYATEPMLATVTARGPDGTDRVLRDDLPGINGITADPVSGRLFADEFRPGGRLWELDPTGERAPTLLLDDLATPNALAVGPDGALYFPLVVAGEVWRYDLDTRAASRVVDGLAQPTAVKFDRAGSLLTSEAGTGHVLRIDLASGHREVVARVARGIDNLALGPDDRLYVSHFTDGRVAEVTGGAERVLSPSGLVGPFGLAPLDGGQVLVADGLSVAVVSAAGVRRTHLLITDLPTLVTAVAVVGDTWWFSGARGQVLSCTEDSRPEVVAGRLDEPGGLCAVSSDAALVVERGAGRLLRIERDGTVAVVASGLRAPQDVAVASDGTTWVTTADGLLGLRDGAQVALVPQLADGQGVTWVDGGVRASGGVGGVVVVACAAPRTVVAFDVASSRVDVLVADAPLGSPVADARLVHAFAPVAADGEGGVLVGGNGDGSIRRLHRAS